VVTTWIGDSQQMDKPSQHNQHQGQLKILCHFSTKFNKHYLAAKTGSGWTAKKLTVLPKKICWI